MNGVENTAVWEEGSVERVKAFTHGGPDSIKSKVPHLSSASSIPSSHLVNLPSQGSVVLRRWLGGRGVCN